MMCFFRSSSTIGAQRTSFTGSPAAGLSWPSRLSPKLHAPATSAAIGMDHDDQDPNARRRWRSSRAAARFQTPTKTVGHGTTTYRLHRVALERSSAVAIVAAGVRVAPLIDRPGRRMDEQQLRGMSREFQPRWLPLSFRSCISLCSLSSPVVANPSPLGGWKS